MSTPTHQASRTNHQPQGSILVTGGAGYIGSHTVKELLKRRYDVVVFDNLSAGHRQFVLTDRFVEGDLLDLDSLRTCFDRFSFDSIVHFAALTSVPDSVRDPQRYYQTNIIAGLNLLQVMLEHDVKKLVFSSSAAVYGSPQVVPIPEDHPKNPESPYGRTKWIFEQILEDYGRAYGLKSISLRYFNAAGSDPAGEIGEWHDPETHLIPIVLAVAQGKREHVEIFGTDYDTPDGTCIRDFIHVSDLAEAHLLALEHLREGAPSTAYNLGTGAGHSVREVVEICSKVTGTEIRAVEAPRRPGDLPRLLADSTRTLKDLRWSPRYPELETIVRTAWDWMTSGQSIMARA
jgi:UDP-glucose 4-epimerase